MVATSPTYSVNIRSSPGFKNGVRWEVWLGWGLREISRQEINRYGKVHEIHKKGPRVIFFISVILAGYFNQAHVYIRKYDITDVLGIPSPLDVLQAAQHFFLPSTPILVQIVPFKIVLPDVYIERLKKKKTACRSGILIEWYPFRVLE